MSAVPLHVLIMWKYSQEWRDAGEIIMHHLPGVINPSDGLTKALAKVLHARHARRAMGHYQPVSTEGSKRYSFVTHARASTT